MKRRCEYSSKKPFCPPFKAEIVRTSVEKYIGLGKRLQNHILHSSGLPENAAYPLSDTHIAHQSTCTDQLPEYEGPADQTHTDVAFSLVTRCQSSTRVFEAGVSDSVLVPHSTSGLPQEKDARVRSMHLPRDANDRLKLVDDTLCWVGAAQKAVQYLANTMADGDVERVLAELHVNPSLVLFSLEEGGFVQP